MAIANALLSMQRSGLAGIVLKYSMASLYPPACCNIDQEVVPRQFFTHLPAGFLPGLAVQVCARQTVTANVVSASSLNPQLDPGIGEYGAVHVCTWLSTAIIVVYMGIKVGTQPATACSCRPSFHS